MSSRKHRPLTDLYNVTCTHLKPQITPNSKQEQLLESDRDTNTASSEIDQESNCNSINQKACLHIMDSKLDEPVLNPCINDVQTEQPKSDVNKPNEKEEVEKSNKSTEIKQASQSDDNNEAEALEQDVKVCDICGDAGREDSLAVCCKCSDGAEHIYCMKNALLEVPQGYWICEECKYDEENEKTVKNSSPIRILGKRYNRDDFEVISVKKQAIESSSMISPKKINQISRENSFKGKEKIAESANPSVTVTQTPRGTFSKSSSFNMRPKSKLVEEVITKEKEGKSIINKSSSFRNMSSSSSSGKVKMLNQSFDNNKGNKLIKEKSLFERKNSFKSDNKNKPSLVSPRIGMNIQAKDKRSTLLKGDTKKQSSSSEEEKISPKSHNTQSCTVFEDVKTVKTEVKNGNFDLKAAIEAARLRKPGIYQRNRSQKNEDQSILKNTGKPNVGPTESSKQAAPIVTNVGPTEVSKQAAPIVTNVGPTESSKQAAPIVTNVGPTESSKQAAPIITNVGPTESSKQAAPIVTNVGPTEVSKPVEAIIESVNSSTHGPTYFSSSISVFWKNLILPEIDFIWQGEFEIHRELKVENIEGFQAHLSTCVSPKVLEPMNKITEKIILNEIPRLNTWPIQFQESGVKHNNIAVYFFAKDNDSYYKRYKILVEYMIKNDLALKGIIDGVELLIFPSNHLPENHQHWNYMSFLWGVFRGKKQQKTVLPSSICSVKPIDKATQINIDKPSLDFMCKTNTGKEEIIRDLNSSPLKKWSEDSNSGIKRKDYEEDLIVLGTSKRQKTESGSSERYFFPIEPVKDDKITELPWKMNHEKTPTLELGLGSETKESIPSFLVAKKKENDDVTASLNLSLAFPFPDKEEKM